MKEEKKKKKEKKDDQKRAVSDKSTMFLARTGKNAFEQSKQIPSLTVLVHG